MENLRKYALNLFGNIRLPVTWKWFLGDSMIVWGCLNTFLVIFEIFEMFGASTPPLEVAFVRICSPLFGQIYRNHVFLHFWVKKCRFRVNYVELGQIWGQKWISHPPCPNGKWHHFRPNSNYFSRSRGWGAQPPPPSGPQGGYSWPNPQKSTFEFGHRTSLIP